MEGYASSFVFRKGKGDVHLVIVSLHRAESHKECFNKILLACPWESCATVAKGEAVLIGLTGCINRTLYFAQGIFPYQASHNIRQATISALLSWEPPLAL